ncbi:MAG: SDR family NAD(P)-dependent oxidoreductase [candidate division KSB1 bacterium]|nr:SDR family NAD(P)-dependent oxidoreductase [candidate division KSB1 bacterium]
MSGLSTPVGLSQSGDGRGSLRGRRVLVTGAGGFIGSHLTEALLREGAEVRAFLRYNSRNTRGLLEELPEGDLREIEIIFGDLKDPAAVNRAVKGVEVVFHLGALIAIPYSYLNPTDFVQTNVLGTLNVLNSCLEYGVARLICTSTSEVYGTLRYAPMDEDHPLDARSPYAASKVGADQLALSYHRAFGLPVTILRPFNTYGPRQSLRAVIPTILVQALRSEVVYLGALHPTRDFNYVTDIVDAFLRAATAPGIEGEIVHVGTGREVSVRELCEAVGRVLGVKVKVVQDQRRLRPAESEVLRLVCNPAKARKLLGWEPRVSLEEGLARTARWIQEHLPVTDPSYYHV